MHYLLYATDGTRHLVPSDTMRVGEAPIANGPETVTKVYGTGFIPHFNAVASFDQIQALIARFGHREDGIFSIEHLTRAKDGRAEPMTSYDEHFGIPVALHKASADGRHFDRSVFGSSNPRDYLLGLEHAKVNAAWRKMWEGSEAQPDDLITYPYGPAEINCGVTSEALRQLIEFMRMQCRPKGGSCIGPGDCAGYPAVTQ